MVPAQLELDIYDGRAWVAVTPFHMSDVRMRALPPIPGMSAFPELNVRTYVKFGGVPGVFFFSLDAASRMAVIGARATYFLPYFHAEMRAEVEGESIRYRSRRRNSSAEFRGRYRPVARIESPLRSVLMLRQLVDELLKRRVALEICRAGAGAGSIGRRKVEGSGLTVVAYFYRWLLFSDQQGRSDQGKRCANNPFVNSLHSILLSELYGRTCE